MAKAIKPPIFFCLIENLKYFYYNIIYLYITKN